jgi:outer membrane receptor protein involved in Fe transport
VRNADLRWEWYPNEEDSLSIALFYKDIDKPIERVVQLASGTAGNSRTFRNAESGELSGVEIEGRKEFLLSDDYSRSLFVSFNASVIESEVSLVNDDPRELQGQPEYTANLVIGYDDFSNGQQLTFLMNQNGASIADVGLSGAPDVYLEPRMEANLVYRWDISETATFKAKLDNIFNSEIEYTQGGQTFQSYEKSTKVSVSIDWDF